MHILSIKFSNFNIPKIKYKQNNIKLKSITTDTISFSGKPKRDYNQEIRQLPEECFPSAGLREFILSQLDNPNNQKDILELHKQYYCGLLNCQSLKEAREIYPEFNSVIDAKNIVPKKLNGISTISKVANGEIEGIKIENLSLELLKKFYASFLTLSSPDEYFGFKGNTPIRMLLDLNIRMDKQYYSILKNIANSYNARKNWQNPEYVKKHKEICSSDEFRAKCSQNKFAYWQKPDSGACFRTPEIRAKRSEIAKNLWQLPDYQTKQDEAYNTPLYKAKKFIINYALRLAWEKHPYAKDAYIEMAKNYPRLKMLITKMEDKTPLTSEENSYYLGYCAAVQKEYPNLKKEIGALQKEILRNLGYRKNMKLSSLLEIIDKIKEDNNFPIE